MSQSQSSLTIPHQKYGGQGPVLHFSAANGYPPLAYRALLEPLSKNHEVIASLHRPLWTPGPAPESIQSWEVFAEDLLQLVNELNQPVVSVGHSMGSAAILMAAVRQPELFSAVVLIEPVLVSRRYLFLLRFFSRFSPNSLPLVKKTLARVDQFSSRQQAFDHYRPKHVFRGIDDSVLWDYVQHGFTEVEPEVFRLCYSKAWEAHCYTLVPNLWGLLSSLKVPALAIRAQQSNTLSLSCWEKWQSLCPSPSVKFLQVEQAGHLLPLEKPDYLADTILAWLNS